MIQQETVEAVIFNPIPDKIAAHHVAVCAETAGLKTIPPFTPSRQISNVLKELGIEIRRTLPIRNTFPQSCYLAFEPNSRLRSGIWISGVGEDTEILISSDTPITWRRLSQDSDNGRKDHPSLPLSERVALAWESRVPTVKLRTPKFERTKGVEGRTVKATAELIMLGVSLL